VTASTSAIVSSTVVLTTTTIVTKTDYVVNGGFEYGYSAWEALMGNETILLTKSNPHSGNFALEFKTKQGSNSSDTFLLQHSNLNNGKGECIVPDTRFGVAVHNGLELSLWYRTSNATADRMGVVVTFQNFTSKISVDYLLAWKGQVPNAVFTQKPQGGPRVYVPVLVNDSSVAWRQTKFNLYEDFMKYSGLDPLGGYYCVSYIAFHQDNFLSQPANRSVEASTYCYFDDVELDELRQ
jgi:hypothetical protein